MKAPSLTLFSVLIALSSTAVEAGSIKNLLSGGKSCKEPSYFTSAFSTRAVDTTIINNDGQSVPGQAGAFGHFAFRINSDKDVICWNIRTVGVTGDYQSPAKTATHIHQADAGRAGPPRLAFPNPQFKRTDVQGKEIRTSSGCMQGPFTTGVQANGQDTGTGFRLKQIEDNPSNFFADTHTQQFSAGAVRGQLLRSELEVRNPGKFTSVLKATATPDQIINNDGQSVAGQEGAKGYYTLRINTDKDIVCYDIKLTGLPSDTKYFSPAKTSTHTHAAPRGSAGPPRLAYKNPAPKSYLFGWKKTATRYSSACIKGPFTTGLLANGVDTGSASGFTLQQLQDNPNGFFSDVHTEARQAGAVRGQLNRA